MGSYLQEERERLTTDGHGAGGRRTRKDPTAGEGADGPTGELEAF